MTHVVVTLGPVLAAKLDEQIKQGWSKNRTEAIRSILHLYFFQIREFEIEEARFQANNSSKPQESQNEPEERVPCPHCKKLFKNEQGLRIHVGKKQCWIKKLGRRKPP